MLRSPLNIHWEVTNRCNLNCVHCYQLDDAADRRLPKSDDLYIIAQRIVDANVFELTLTGGEILLVPELWDLIRFFNTRGIAPHITTNGTLIDDVVAERLCSFDVTVQISIDSADPKTHDAIRGKRDAFKRAVRGMNCLVGAGVPTSVSFTVMPTNTDDVRGVVDLADSAGVGRVCVGPVLPMFGHNADTLVLDKSWLHGALPRLEQLRAVYAGRVDLQIAFGSASLEQGLGGQCSKCTAMDRDMAILHDGAAYPCPFVRSPVYRLGSVIETSIAELWASDVAIKFREERDGSPTPHCMKPSAASPGSHYDDHYESRPLQVSVQRGGRLPLTVLERQR